MNFLSLEYFDMIARERSIRRAADRLFVSQQSLSEHLKKLEMELGAALVSRTRPLSLTPEGERFLEGAREILSARERMLADIREMTDREETVTLGISPIGTPPFLSELVSAFQEEYPQSTLGIVSWDPKTLPAQQREIDLFFLPPPLKNDMVHVILKEDYPVLVVSRRLLERTYGERAESLIGEMREKGDLSLMKELTFIDYGGSHGGGYASLRKTGLKKSRLMIESVQLALSMCVEGKGALIALEDAVLKLLGRYSREDARQVLTFRLKNMQSQCLAISYRKGKRLRPVEKAFIRKAQELLGNWFG
ncbi:MAG: LysR family transcriptional regulator [Oscillospiraceae bacterium]|jgi:DNA-binding transcriptional LysR family regulator